MPQSVTAESPVDQRSMRSVTHWPAGDGVVVAAMSDGYFQTTMVDTVRRLEPSEAARLHQARGARLPPRITHMNYAITAPGAPVTLVDAGMGSRFGDSVGHLPVALRAAGIDSHDVGLVLLTHLHLDHAAGLLDDDGGPRYPGATVVVDPVEVDHWTDPDQRARADDDLLPWFEGAARVLEAYDDRLATPQELPRLTPLSIDPVPLAGHTPGHLGYHLRTSTGSLTFVGDLVHMPAVQGPRPDACMVFDVDPGAAARTRRRLLAEVAGTSGLIAGGHTEYPGLVSVTTSDGEHFELVPAPWVDHL